MNQAHVIVHIQTEGIHRIKRVHSVVLGSKEVALNAAERLNQKYDYDERDEDGTWWGHHFTVETVPMWEEQ